jgi:hypothetical protein
MCMMPAVLAAPATQHAHCCDSTTLHLKQWSNNVHTAAGLYVRTAGLYVRTAGLYVRTAVCWVWSRDNKGTPDQLVADQPIETHVRGLYAETDEALTGAVQWRVTALHVSQYLSFSRLSPVC